MEEQKENEKELVSGGANEPEKTEETGRGKIELNKRSCILWTLAGVYLVYSGFQMCRNVLRGVEGGSPVFFVIGALFAVFGAVLAFMGIRGFYRIDMKKKAEAAKEAEEQEALEEKSEEEQPPAAKAGQRMSIAERAKLVNTLAEEAADGTADEAAGTADDASEASDEEHE